MIARGSSDCEAIGGEEDFRSTVRCIAAEGEQGVQRPHSLAGHGGGCWSLLLLLLLLGASTHEKTRIFRAMPAPFHCDGP